MSVRRRWRIVTIILSLCALLVSQGAVAAYACQGAAKAYEVAQMTEAAMPCADTMSKSMDDEQPTLCHAHCQSAQGALDHFQPVDFAPTAVFGPVLTIVLAAKPVSTGVQVQASVLRPSASPPLAISNCCFRI